MSLLRRSCLAALVLAAPAAPAAAERVVGLGQGNTLVIFDSSTPGNSVTRTIFGAAAGETLTGLDLRPANNTLYTLSTAGNIYALTAVSGGFSSSLVSTLTTPLSGPGYGFDFNPVPDRLRFITADDQNLRINVATGAATIDGTISAPGDEEIVGSAYTNSDTNPATGTQLFALDGAQDLLLTTADPNGGVYTALGPLGVDIGGRNNTVGFDISGLSGLAIYNSLDQLYSVDLTNGSSTLLGSVGGGPLRGLTFATVPVPEPATWAMMIGGVGLIGGALRRRARPAAATA